MLEVELGKYLKLSGSEVKERAETALRYVSGENRKWEKHDDQDPISYQEFKHLVELANKQQ